MLSSVFRICLVGLMVLSFMEINHGFCNKSGLQMTEALAHTANIQISQNNAGATNNNPQNIPAKQNNASVKLLKQSPFKQGGSIMIFVNSSDELVNPKVTFAGKTTNLFKQSNGEYKGLTGVEANVKHGGYNLKVCDDSGFLNYSEQIEVLSGKFPIQNIRISGGKASLEPTKEELEKINAAKNSIDIKSYWTDRPFIVPTKGCVASVYGLNRYHNGKPTGDYHKGQDIRAPQGAAIVATAPGKVLLAQQFRLHGGTVSVDHGQGLMSIYIHMSKISVKPGQMVKAGEKLGEVGATGFATGPHLHWGLYIFGIPINPVEWLPPVNRC